MKNNRFRSILIFNLIILLFSVGLGACTLGDEPGSLVGPEWRLASIDGEAIPAEVNITATFGEEEVAGSSGCNSYSGPYTVDGDKIQIGPMVSTLMACEEPMMSWEGTYLMALQAAQSFKLSADELEITTGNGTLLYSVN